MNSYTETLAQTIPARPTLRGHLQVMRIDHWFKNVFVLPGVIAALGVDMAGAAPGLWWRFALGMISVCLVASSNYVINEVLDAPSDRSHPVKRMRPVPSGLVSVPLAVVQWLLLMVVGVTIGLQVSTAFAIVVFILWVMGCIYNIPPVRSKDARGLVHCHLVVGRTGVAASELLDGRLLLHGAQALCRVP
jgi:decaprenyl-phosphate phosphoribosyltransferase